MHIVYMATYLKILFVIAELLFVFNNIVSGYPTTTPLSILCNTQLFSSEGPFPEQLRDVFQDLVSITPDTFAYNYYTLSMPSTGVYGHGVYNIVLSSADCRTCKDAARELAIINCPMRVGAQCKRERLGWKDHGASLRPLPPTSKVDKDAKVTGELACEGRGPEIGR
ncbi:hypothetical protein CRG98_001507 [Punica granatum]|uniref:Gnk2-homologous domain-containing protein n=1 Tax=Punica granatum TaxID=22663 RepID=A0A2I0LBW8_PUNGR|nr:hypothetical protein CRG98_001507 [Punica granatum]